HKDVALLVVVVSNQIAGGAGEGHPAPVVTDPRRVDKDRSSAQRAGRAKTIARDQRRDTGNQVANKQVTGVVEIVQSEIARPALEQNKVSVGSHHWPGRSLIARRHAVE